MRARLQSGLALLIAFSGLVGCSHQRQARWSPSFNVKREIFKNGLTVLFVEDHSAPVVSYTTWFKVGSAWEKPGSTGIAHLFEHMMFKGTPRYSGKEFFHKLESRGAMVNAFTQQDTTVYYEVIASQHLEMVIDMESDRLANLAFTQKDLDAERQVVKEERRLRVESNFGAQQMEQLQKFAFPTHPYGWPIVGYQEDLDRLSLEQCRKFFNDYYQPANAVITIAGDFEYEKAKAWIEKYYGSIQGHPVPALQLAAEKLEGGEKRLVIERPVKAESVLMAYYIPSMYDKDAEELSMLAWSVFGMASSRANLKLVREKQIALGVGAEAMLARFPNLFLISVEMRNGLPASLGERELDELIEEVKNTPLPVDELDRVKNRLIYSTVNEAKSPSGLASWFASGEFYWKDHKHIFKMLDSYHSITPQGIQAAARKYLRKENRVVVVMRPEAKQGRTR